MAYAPVQKQGAQFDVAGVLSDRSRRSGTNQTNSPETTLGFMPPPKTALVGLVCTKRQSHPGDSVGAYCIRPATKETGRWPPRSRMSGPNDRPMTHHRTR